MPHAVVGLQSGGGAIQGGFGNKLQPAEMGCRTPLIRASFGKAIQAKAEAIRRRMALLVEVGNSAQNTIRSSGQMAEVGQPSDRGVAVAVISAASDSARPKFPLLHREMRLTGIGLEKGGVFLLCPS